MNNDPAQGISSLQCYAMKECLTQLSTIEKLDIAKEILNANLDIRSGQHDVLSIVKTTMTNISDNIVDIESRINILMLIDIIGDRYKSLAIWNNVKVCFDTANGYDIDVLDRTTIRFYIIDNIVRTFSVLDYCGEYTYYYTITTGKCTVNSHIDKFDFKKYEWLREFLSIIQTDLRTSGDRLDFS